MSQVRTTSVDKPTTAVPNPTPNAGASSDADLAELV
jgi:hypothetical protein